MCVFSVVVKHLHRDLFLQRLRLVPGPVCSMVAIHHGTLQLDRGHGDENLYQFSVHACMQHTVTNQSLAQLSSLTCDHKEL